MRIIDECVCPNCKVKIEKQRVRRPSIRVKEEKTGKARATKFIKVSGTYKWVVSQSVQEVNSVPEVGGKE